MNSRLHPVLRLTQLARLSHLAVAAALTAMASLAQAAAPGALLPADPAKGQQLAATCLACHTADGSRGIPANPILQAQHPGYMVKQLTEFKSGKRQNAIMMGMSMALSEEDMRHISAFYGSKPMVPGESRNKDSIALGERIYRGGIVDKGIPACSGCHSPNGAGVPSLYPRLGGQHAEYTQAQLLIFRSGERGNSAQMMGIAAKMNDAEIQAVSDFIAGLR